MNASTNHPARESAARTVAIDLAKEVFELAFADAEHRIVARERLARGPLARRLDDRLARGPLARRLDDRLRQRAVVEARRSAHRQARHPCLEDSMMGEAARPASTVCSAIERPHMDVRAGLRSTHSAARA